MKTFTLPPDDDDQDGAPEFIAHGIDYMFTAPETPEFYYSFLVYSWTIEGEAVTARAYLDDVLEVTVFAAAAKLETSDYQPMLRYLQRRYRVIKTFGGAETYFVAYKR